MICRNFSHRVAGLAAVVALLAGASSVHAQGTGTSPGGSKGLGINQPNWPPIQLGGGTMGTGGTVGGTTGGMIGGTSGGTGGGLGGLGAGGILPPDQEYQILLAAIVTTEAIIETTGMQGDGMDVLYLFLMVYTEMYAEAVQGGVNGGMGGGTGTGMGMGSTGITPFPPITKTGP